MVAKKNTPILADYAPKTDTFREEVIAALQRPQKELPSKYFYDERGSVLFDQICDLPEYYPTRTETAIMESQIGEMVAALGEHCLLIEYGSGSSTKTRLLLDALQAPAGYVPIDISKEHLMHSAGKLAKRYPTLEILPVCADYTRDFAIPQPRGAVKQRVVYFPGSTIGNFDHPGARRFLRHVAEVCQGGGLLIGVDRKKDAAILHRAYNDAAGVTAAFNLNLLTRINRELDADFDLSRFGHYAFYHPSANRIEMHLISQAEHVAQIGPIQVPFAEGESIWTESSYKYTLSEFAILASSTGFTLQHTWTDPLNFFSVMYLTAS